MRTMLDDREASEDSPKHRTTVSTDPEAVLGKIMTAAVCVLHAKRAAKMQRVDVLRLSGQRFRADLRKTAWKL